MYKQGAAPGAAGILGTGCGRKTTLLEEVSVQHVSCAEDAAAFVALSAVLDLSMYACRLFSDKLRKELQPLQDLPF